MATKKTNADAKYGAFVREDRQLPDNWQNDPSKVYGGWLPQQLGAGEDLYWGDPTWNLTYYGDERDSFLNAYLDTSGHEQGSGGNPVVEFNWDKMPKFEREGQTGYSAVFLHDDDIGYRDDGTPYYKGKGYTWAMGGIHDPEAIYWDPNYGWYTNTSNWSSGKLGSTIGGLMMSAFSGPMWAGILQEIGTAFPAVQAIVEGVGAAWDKITMPFDKLMEGFTEALEQGWKATTDFLENIGIDVNEFELSSDAARSIGIDKDLAQAGISPTGSNGGFTFEDIGKLPEFSGPPNIIDPLQEPVSDVKKTPWDYGEEPWPDLNDLGEPATGNDYGLTTKGPDYVTTGPDGTGAVTHTPGLGGPAAAATTTAAAKTVWDKVKDIWDAGGTIDDVIDIIRGVAPGILQYLSAEDFEDWLNGYMTDESLWKKLDPFGDQRAGYQDRLRQVVENPEQFFKNDPGYQFLQNEGLRAAQASAGPYGKYGSSNAASWALDRALGTAATQRFNEIAALSPLAGAQFGPESYAGLYRDAFKAAGEARKGMYTGINQAVAGALGENTRTGTGQGGNANLVSGVIDLGKTALDLLFPKG